MSFTHRLARAGNAIASFVHAFVHPAEEVTIGDFQYIQGNRFAFQNPHVDRRTILSFLVKSPVVKEACTAYDLRGEYALQAVIIDSELRVNVYEINPPSGTPGECQPYMADWVDASIMQYTLAMYAEDRILGTQHKGEIKVMDGVVFGAFIDPFAPVWSWKLELDHETERALGLKVLG